MLPQHRNIFEPMTIGKIKLDNRIALAPTHVGMGDDKGMATDQLLCYYYARALGGVGLIIVEITGITGRYAFIRGRGLGAASDQSIPGLLDLARVIHWGGAKAVQDAGADYLSVSQGCYGSATHIFPEEEGTVTQDAAAIRKAVQLPVMCPNFQNPDKVAEAVSNGSVDLAALSRALLADPLWARKVKEGRPDTIKPCKRCYQCIQMGVVEHVPVRCPVNPSLGFERFDPECFPKPKGGRGGR